MKLIDSIIRQPARVSFGRNADSSDTDDVVALDSSRDADSATITAADGSFVVIPGATETTAGILTAADKALVGIAALHYESAAEVADATVPAQRGYLRTWGHSSPGDGGAALYKRVPSEPSHPGKVQSADGAWWELAPDRAVNVLQLGATRDGTTDDSAAFSNAATAAHHLGIREVLIPAGEYLINTPGAMNVASPGVSGVTTGFAWRGAGKEATNIKFINTGVATDYLCDIDNDGIWITFADIGFKGDPTNKNSRFLRLYCDNGQAGKLDVYGCRWKNFERIAEFDGTVNADETNWVACMVSGCYGKMFSWRNPQAVIHNFFGCLLESAWDDVFYVEQGGTINVFGGSVIISPNAVAGTAILHLNPTSPQTYNYNFVGIKGEFPTVNAKLVQVSGNQDVNSTIRWTGCDFTGNVKGGARDAVDLRSDCGVSLIFDACKWDASFDINLAAPNASNYNLTYGYNAQVILQNCRVPVNIHDKVNWEAGSFGLVRLRGCHAGDPSDSTESSVAFDADLIPAGPGHPRLSRGPELKTYTGFIRYWPNSSFDRDGSDTRITLPPGSTLKSIRLRKRTGTSTSTASYRLAVISDTGDRLWGLSNTTQQRYQVDLNEDDIWAHINDAEGRTLRVVPTWEVTYSGKSGTPQVGETFTGGTSGATGILLRDTGTVWDFWMQSGDFSAGETLTGGTSGASATADSVADLEGVGVVDEADAGDLWLVEYL